MSQGSSRWTAADVPDQSGRTAVVTGASSGLGLVTASVLARHGAAVILACRDLAKAEQAAGRIRAGSAGASVRVVRLDLASLASVREAASEIRAACPRLDLLINNAAVMRPPYQRPDRYFADARQRAEQELMHQARWLFPSLRYRKRR